MGVVYVLEDGYLAKDGGTLKVSKRGPGGGETLLEKPLIGVEEIVVLGNAVVTPALLKHCAEENIGLHYVSTGGRYFAGLTAPPPRTPRRGWPSSPPTSTPRASWPWPGASCSASFATA